MNDSPQASEFGAAKIKTIQVPRESRMEAIEEQVRELNGFGIALAQHGDLDSAMTRFLQALQLKLDDHATLCNLGCVLTMRGELDDAAFRYRQALELKPDSIDALRNLGVVLRRQGKFTEAIASFRQTLNLWPNDAQSAKFLAHALKEIGNAEEAVAQYRHALRSNSRDPELHHSLGFALQDLGRREEAISCYREALRLKPDYAEVHHCLAIVLADREEAIAHLRQAAFLRPDYAPAVVGLVHTLQHACQWDDLETLALRAVEVAVGDGPRANAAPASPFAVLALPVATTPEQQLRAARRWVENRLQASVDHGCRAEAVNPRRDKPRLTLGFLSADIRAHPIAYLIAEMIEKFDRTRFEVIGYSYGLDDGSDLRRRLVPAFERFRDES